MYCKNCKNQLLKTSNFCPICGAKQEETKPIEHNTIKTLPMKWYNFFTYALLPLFIIANIAPLYAYNYSTFIYDKLELGMFLINISLICLFSVSFFMLHKKIKGTMTCVVLLLIVASVYSLLKSIDNSASIITTITAICVCFIPNYIYFNNRKNIFIN